MFVTGVGTFPFISRKAENPVGAWIPEINGSCAVGSYDRV
jgi:hypothetical protein